MDWAEKRARSIVDAYRPIFREDAAAHVDSLVNVVAGELRAGEERARQQAVAAGEALLATLSRLSCT